MRNGLRAALAAALVASTSATAAPSPAPAPVPIADLADPPTIGRPPFSTDGRKLAALSWEGEKGTLLVIDADKPEAQPQSIALGKTDITALN